MISRLCFFEKYDVAGGSSSAPSSFPFLLLDGRSRPGRDDSTCFGKTRLKFRRIIEFCFEGPSDILLLCEVLED